MRLTDPVTLAGRTAPARIVFGPHETNLGHRRAFSARHVAYYQRRADGGAGVIITETASVHPSDWPYERAPLAAGCAGGWRAIADACHPAGPLVLAGLGHTGLQGSSAYSQAALWGPGRFTDPVSRETPMVMEQPELDALVAGFAEAAGVAAAAGLDGVEIDAGPGALLRQFHSGLTSQRTDRYGEDRLALTAAVLTAVRAVIGRGRVLALRLSCDELAPWAGITPEAAAGQAAALAPHLDLLTVVRGGPYSASAYRPDGHTPPMVNLALAGAIRAAAGGAVPVVLQGSVVDVAAAQAALDDGAADLAEMTRAQIADAELVAKLRAGQAGRIRPCLLCNQACLVRDSRNPVITCVGDPRSGHETEEPADGSPAADGLPASRDVLVVGGGPAGLEAARAAALAGHTVRLAERAARPGGALRAAAAAPGRERLALLADWLESECRRLGVRIDTGTEITAAGLAAAQARGTAVLLATGSRPVTRFPGSVDALSALSGAPLPDGPAVVHDPVGGPAGVAVAEWLAGQGRPVTVVTQDQVVGSQLSLTGDLAGANVRLQQAGVTRALRSLLRDAGDGTALLEDVWTGE
ncbi:MAG TPA: mycofactocin system FadH/OYE family oxidoreductase 1, partial [Streptosporangiaceae bacterium]|nr:mycofactocin system FadH/OYE family oxidoreductase 1 [Streptosporangiaceae bacterium]